MSEVFGIPLPALLSQLLLGLVNGSFYAILSLGLAVIFGLLNVINFAHGALYMMGAMFAWMGLTYFGLNYWVMLVLAPLLVGLFGVVIERPVCGSEATTLHRGDPAGGVVPGPRELRAESHEGES